MKLYLNPAYAIKPDGNRVLLIARTGLYSLISNANTSFTGVIHPLHAILLSFIDGSEKETVIQRASSYLQISPNIVCSFIDRLTNNPEDTGFEYKGQTIGFPRNLIISKFDYDIPISRYNPDDFLICNPSLKYGRHNTVSSLTLMLNNICTTKCFYCYADKRIPQNCSISFDRISELISEAKSSNVINFDLIGGEVFLYPYWEGVLERMVTNDYYPFVSTKMPLSEKTIESFSRFNLPIQFSLDCMNLNILRQTLNVNNDYIENVKDMFKNLGKYNVKVAVHSVLHQYNCFPKEIENLFNFLNNQDNILYWKPDLGNESIYSPLESKGCVTPNPNDIKFVYNKLEELATKANIDVKYEGIEPPSVSEDSSKGDMATSITSFLNRAYCAGNFSQLFILPDGKVTICEELYWHPHFIIGDIKIQSLAEIWQSNSALSLYNVSQESISSKSKCRTCNLFSQCRSEKQICYRDIIRKHGVNNWDLPDVNCPLA